MHTIHRAVTALALAGVTVLAATAVAAQEPKTFTGADGETVVVEDVSRVATLGGVFTEIAYALGAQDQLVAVDDSSYYPPAALEQKPSFGYYRFLTAEPVLAADPSLIVGNEETGPPDVVSQLRDAGIPILLLPDGNSVEGARSLISTLGRVLGREDAADALMEQLDADVAAAEALVAQATDRPRVLFVYRPPDAPTLVAGEVSAAGSMIELAGGENIYPGFPGYIPMTPEGIVSTAPDVILTSDDSIDQFGGLDAFLAAPGIAQTTAVQEGRVIVMEDLYLLGFGPRTGQAIADLAQQLHPELAP